MINIERYIESKNLGGRVSSKGELTCCCPFHDDRKPSFSINIETGLWLCRSSSCGLHGNFPLFFKLIENIYSWKEVKKKLDLNFKVPAKDLDDLLNFNSQKKVRDDEIKYQELPSDTFVEEVSESNFPRWLSDRSYTYRDIKDFDLRIGIGGVWRNCLIFPYYGWNGELLTYVSRRMKDKIGKYESKYVYPPDCPKSRILYGINLVDDLDYSKYLFLVEGPFDVMRLNLFGEVAVGLSGCEMSDRQLLDISKICKLASVKPVLMLDSDADDKAENIYYNLGAANLKPKWIRLPIGNDPDNLSYKEFYKLKQEVNT